MSRQEISRSLRAADPLKHIVIAHRGVSGLHPDNTREAFEAALDGGDGIETDVRMTLDGRLVLVHDDLVDGRPVHALTYAELRDRLPGLIKLGELLDLCSPEELLMIEIKYKGLRDGHGLIEEAVLAELERVGRLNAEYAGSTAIGSFSPGCLLYLRRAAERLAVPRLPLIQILEGASGSRASRYSLLELVCGYAVAIAPSLADITSIPWSDLAHAHGLGALPYTPGSVVTLSEHREAIGQSVRGGYDGGIYNHTKIAREIAGIPKLPATEAMRWLLEAASVPEGLSDDAHGEVAARLLQLGNGSNQSVADLLAARAYAAPYPQSSLTARIDQLLATR